MKLRAFVCGFVCAALGIIGYEVGKKKPTEVYKYRYVVVYERCLFDGPGDVQQIVEDHQEVVSSNVVLLFQVRQNECFTVNYPRLKEWLERADRAFESVK